MNCEEVKKRIGIRTVLESFQRFPVKDNQRTAFYFALDREERTASLSVDFVKDRAFDFGTGKSYDIISIVQVVKQCSVSQALEYLSSLDISPRPVNNAKSVSDTASYKIDLVQDLCHPALFQYLRSRKVFGQRHLVKEIHYSINGKKYFGIAFRNNSGGYEIRNQFSKICLGSKDVTLLENPLNISRDVFIFEGFFDFLTFRMIESNFGYSDIVPDYLILNSTSMFFRAEKLLENYNAISLFLNNDRAGEDLKSKIQSQYQNVEDCSIFYSGGNDLNEWFCAQ